jgi:hypothetical protein
MTIIDINTSQDLADSLRACTGAVQVTVTVDAETATSTKSVVCADCGELLGLYRTTDGRMVPGHVGGGVYLHIAQPVVA